MEKVLFVVNEVVPGGEIHKCIRERACIAGRGSEVLAMSARSNSAVNSGLDYINGHGNLPDAPTSSTVANNAALTTNPPVTKKGAKSKKAADPNETGKLLAAKINQLELDAVEEKDQELEIGSCFALNISVPSLQEADEFNAAPVFTNETPTERIADCSQLMEN